MALSGERYARGDKSCCNIIKFPLCDSQLCNKEPLVFIEEPLKALMKTCLNSGGDDETFNPLTL